jgi:hypothetical protein
MSLSLIFMIFTVPGNLLVIMAVLKDPHKDVRSPFTLLILNLAVTDLIVGCLVEPLSVYIHYREGRGLHINMAWLSQTAYFLCCTASLLSLATLTVDRYLAIARAVWYRANINNRRVVYVSISVWCLSIGFTSIFFEVGFISYAFVFANIAILSTFAIFMFTYVQVFKVLKRQLTGISAVHDGCASELERAHRRSMMWETRITKAYLIVLAVFLACYVPSCIMIYLMNMCKSCSCDLIHWFRDAQFILVTINSLINPFVYAFRLKNIRRSVITILKPIFFWKANTVNIARDPSDVTPAETKRTTSTSSEERLKLQSLVEISRHSPEFNSPAVHVQ